MINKEILNKYDPQRMYEVYDNWPKIARDSYEKKIKPLSCDNVNHLVFVGMGGSGTVSDIFYSILSQTSIRVTVIKGYVLPKNIDKNTLVVITSMSGDTEEALTALQSSLQYNCMKIAFSAGGLIEKFANNNKIEHRSLIMYLNPRSSLPSAVYTILNVLGDTLSIDKNDVYDSIRALEDYSKKICSDNLTDTNPSLKLAMHLSEICLIYYPHGLQTVATRFKNSIHENMKKHASIENIIESCHNQIMAWDDNTNVLPILLRGSDDHVKTIDRWDVIKELFETRKINYEEFSVSGNNILTKTISSIYELDYATLYRAVIEEKDPHIIESIQYIKKLMKKNK